MSMSACSSSSGSSNSVNSNESEVDSCNKSSEAGFQIKYEVKESSIPSFGLGLFAKQFIPKNTLIWKYKRDVNVRSYSNIEEIRNRLNELDADDQYFFMSHVYLFNGMMNEILDDGTRWNHSEDPNTGTGSGVGIDWFSTYAIKDIQEGEELFDDYGTYEYPDYFIQLAKEYKVPQDFIVKKDFKKPGFHIEYEIKPSNCGLGLFTKQFIPKNALIWKYASGLNIRSFKNDEEVRKHLATLSDYAEQYDFLSHVYSCDGLVNEILDDGKMWNHSEDPNTCSGYLGDDDSTYAKRDIEAGEELLDDYGLYDYPEWFMPIAEEYHVPYDFVTIKNAKE